MTRTLKERLIAGHLALGWSQVKNPRSRYVEFTKVQTSKTTGECFVAHHFIGENGALRSGPCASQSSSLQFGTRKVVDFFLAKGDEALGTTGSAEKVGQYLTE